MTAGRMLYSVVDDRSGVYYQEYRCVYGEDVEAAHYYPEDESFLIEFAPRVKHFEVTRER